MIAVDRLLKRWDGFVTLATIERLQKWAAEAFGGEHLLLKFRHRLLNSSKF